MAFALRCVYLNKIRQLSRTLQFSTTQNGLKLSESCVKRLMEICDKNSFLRIVIEGGGCSGFQYKFHIDNNLESDDLVYGGNIARVVIDRTSLQYVDGSTIDFHTELIRSGFRIIGNPKAEKGCSCGASFSIKLE
ncbi:iron-sulfur cluster assembly 2 homolog, mitochondrial [Wyeomyia smithii]|uniref:iron-sulfur cluster assembly 2 homolog, mitochondrial n=1 Tax=Wyeomyia smithii TaxID=174621 RepID=UPI002467D5C2|nr:iron-sulfur cluster assembly 2 homolog, mitochondrial [Wyeomyia smithii]